MSDNEDIVKNDMKLRQEKQKLRVAELSDNGHVCVRIQNTYPIKILYCGEDVCTRVVPINGQGKTG